MTRPNFIPVVFAIGFAALIALVCVSSMMVEAGQEPVVNEMTCE